MELGDAYAVGRLWFDDLQAYHVYAQRLVEFERRPAELRRSLTFFGPANPDDTASQFIAYKLIMPLFERLKRESGDWNVSLVDPPRQPRPAHAALSPRATAPAGHHRAGGGIPTGPRPPASFTRRHCLPGLARTAQMGQELPPDFFLSGEDIPADADLTGMISIHMSDYSLGTPLRSEAQGMLFDDVPQLTHQPFIASLPQRMLARGALASVGLADKFWNVGFPNLTLFSPDTLVVAESCLRYLLQGAMLGVAMQPFRQRGVELTSQLSMLREEAQFGKSVDCRRW